MKRKFKIGDRVKCVGRQAGCVVGDTCKIINIDGTHMPYLVELDTERSNYHDGGLSGVKGKPNCCYWCYEETLELILNHEPIIIYQNGREVVAFDKESGKKAVAKCSPNDEFDFMTGAKLAFERLVEPTTVDRTAKVGEYVKVLSEGGHCAKKDSILKVKKVFDEDGWVDVYLDDKMSRITTLRREQYVVAENYKPEVKRNKILRGRPDGAHLGIIGKETLLRDINGEQLYVGDTVELFHREMRPWGLYAICNTDANGDFVMSIANSSNTKENHGKIADGWKIIKRASYADLKVGDVIDDVKVDYE